MDIRDSQLAMAMVYGVLRWRGYLDSILAKFASHPLTKMKPLTREALRLGLFQILFLDRVPDSAAINETVKALKSTRQPKWIYGFVNGVLRNILRQKESLSLSEEEASRLSHPDWLVKRWQEIYGKDRAAKICLANNAQPSLCLRVNTRKITVQSFLAFLEKEGITCVPGKYGPATVVLPEYRGPVSSIPGYAEGLFLVQDEGAQLIAPLLGPFTTGRYLDGCAGLGGKSLTLAQELPEEAVLVAVEPSERRIALLRENMQRLQAHHIKVHQETLQRFAAQHKEKYQGILLDVPCSGLGVIRRHPEIRWSRTPADLKRYQAQQLELLQTAARLLDENGILVYATCSIDPLENDAVIESFLKNNSEFLRTDCRETLPPQAHCLVDQHGFLRTAPDMEIDGFFAARMKKERKGSKAQAK